MWSPTIFPFFYLIWLCRLVFEECVTRSTRKKRQEIPSVFLFWTKKKNFQIETSIKSSAEYHEFSKFFTFSNMSNSDIKEFFNFFFLNSIQNFNNKNNNNKFEKNTTFFNHPSQSTNVVINKWFFQFFFAFLWCLCVCVLKIFYFKIKTKTEENKIHFFIYTRPSFLLSLSLSSVFLPMLSFQLYESTYIRWCSGWSIVNSEKWKIWRSGSIISLSFSFIFLVILSISLFLLLFFIIFFSFNCWTNIYTKWLWWCQNINDDDDDEKIEIFISLLLSSFQFHH